MVYDSFGLSGQEGGKIANASDICLPTPRLSSLLSPLFFPIRCKGEVSYDTKNRSAWQQGTAIVSSSTGAGADGRSPVVAKQSDAVPSCFVSDVDCAFYELDRPPCRQS